MNLTNSDKIANTPVMLTLFNGYTVPMRQLTIQQMADLDAYVRSKFLRNSLKAMEELTWKQQDDLKSNLLKTAQTITYTSEVGRQIIETEIDGYAFQSFVYITNDYDGDFNSWKDLFLLNAEENVRLFHAALYVLFYTNDKHTKSTEDPEIIYKNIEAALKKGFAFDVILSLTPQQIDLLINGADDGLLHFNSVEEMMKVMEARQKEKQV